MQRSFIHKVDCSTYIIPTLQYITPRYSSPFPPFLTHTIPQNDTTRFNPIRFIRSAPLHPISCIPYIAPIHIRFAFSDKYTTESHLTYCILINPIPRSLSSTLSQGRFDLLSISDLVRDTRVRGEGICKPRYHYLWWRLFGQFGVSLGLISQGQV